jgi:hypothetical protein
MPKIERSEEDQMFMLPSKVRLGEMDYEIRPLPMRKSAEWRAKFTEEVHALGEHMKGDAASMDKFVGGLKFAFLKFPAKISEMVFSYAPDLPREVIENEASDEQMASAFSVVLQISFPYAAHLTLAQTVRQAAQSL